MLAARRACSVALVIGLASGCDVPPASPSPSVEPSPTAPEPVEPEPAKLEPASPEPEPAEPAKPVFDPTTATGFRARIVEVHNRKQWVPCGYIHSVGVLEVEVLDVGDPAPHVLLFVSCPVDRSGPKLAAGTLVEVTLYARKQRWTTISGLPKHLPQRYVETLTEALPE